MQFIADTNLDTPLIGRVWVLPAGRAECGRCLAQVEAVSAPVAGWRQSCLRGGIAEELLQVMAGDDPASADLHEEQVAAAHLVVEQVTGQAGRAGSFVDGIGQPPGELQLSAN